MKSIKGLIFDLDDTIVESEKINVHLITEYFRDVWNIALDDEDQSIVFGYSWQHIYDFITRKYKLPVSIDTVQEQVLARKGLYLAANRLTVATGIEEVLRLPVKKVIVSGSGRSEIVMMLGNAGLSSYFDAHFSVDDYINGKPAPDGFLMALSYLRLEPSDVLVFEDSRSGLISARSAGLTTVFIKEFANHDHSALADHCFDTFGDFYQRLKSPPFSSHNNGFTFQLDL